MPEKKEILPDKTYNPILMREVRKLTGNNSGTG
jgi:hypothetical protein